MLGIMRENCSRRFTLFQRVNFLKAKVLSRAVYIALVLPCPEEVSDKILSSIVTFTFLGKLEKPARSVLFRPCSEGGISLPHPALMFDSLFLKYVYNTLIVPDSCESSLLRFWMGFPLRRHLDTYKGNSFPTAVFKRPDYLQKPVHQIIQLLEANIIQRHRRLVHRQVYTFWVKGTYGRGKYENLYPNLDWNSIWRRTSKLPDPVRETFFLFNHRLLPTGVRCHRLQISTNANCKFCQQSPESDEHLMLDCPSRQASTSWLKRTVTQEGCSTPPLEFIRGHIGRTPKAQDIFALVAAYVHITWKERKDNRIPSGEEVESFYRKIQAKP
jgi:hypothetical protein